MRTNQPVTSEVAGLSRRLKCIVPLFAAWGILGPGATSVLADSVIFSDFGPGNTYTNNSGFIVSSSGSLPGYSAFAMAFTPTATSTLAQIDIALGFSSGSNSATVNLDADNAGAPGTTLMSWTFTNVPSEPTDGTTVQTGTATSTLPLLAGTQYWLVASPTNPTGSTWIGWNFNNTGDTGTVDNRTSPKGAWQPSGYSQPAAFDILGTNPVSSTVSPEPASSGLVIGGFGLLAGALRRTHQRRTTRRSSTDS